MDLAGIVFGVFVFPKLSDFSATTHIFYRTKNEISFVLESVAVKQYLVAVSEISKFPIKLYTEPSSVF